jgi:hypothetical protein
LVEDAVLEPVPELSGGALWCRPHVLLFVGTKQETPPHHPIPIIAICTYSASAPQLNSKHQQMHFLAVDHVSVIAPS